MTDRVGGGRQRGRRRHEDDQGDDLFDGMLESVEAGAHDDSEQPFGGFDMHGLQSLVWDAQQVFPMRIPKPKGLARLLNPEEASGPPQYDHAHPFGLQPFDFEPTDTPERFGHYRVSAVDRLLSTHEIDGATTLPDIQALSTVESWLDALELPSGARMRRNPRFLRVLEEFAHPSKFTDKQKRHMLHSLKFGLACDPERAGYENGKTPYAVPGFDPSEMEAFQPQKRGGQTAANE